MKMMNTTILKVIIHQNDIRIDNDGRKYIYTDEDSRGNKDLYQEAIDYCGRFYSSPIFKVYIKDKKLSSLEKNTKIQIFKTIKNIDTKLDLLEKFDNLYISNFYKIAEPYLNKN